MCLSWRGRCRWWLLTSCGMWWVTDRGKGGSSFLSSTPFLTEQAVEGQSRRLLFTPSLPHLLKGHFKEPSAVVTLCTYGYLWTPTWRDRYLHIFNNSILMYIIICWYILIKGAAKSSTDINFISKLWLHKMCMWPVQWPQSMLRLSGRYSWQCYISNRETLLRMLKIAEIFWWGKKQLAMVQRSHNPTIYRAACNNLNRQGLSI